MAIFCLTSAVLVAAALAMPHEMLAVPLLSVMLGVAGLIFLTIAAKVRPVWALSIWGGLFLPLSGAWVVPAFQTPFEIFLVLLGLALSGLLFYGGTAAVLGLILRGRLIGLRFIIAPLAVPFAEYLAMQSGLIMAPVGLLAVIGGWAWCVEVLGAIATGGVLLCFATAFAGTSHQGVRTAMLVALILVTVAPAPPQPDYAGPQITAVAHNPDSVGKWTEKGAQDGLDLLIERSKAARGQGLIVWSENAVSGTFSVETALAQLGDVPTPLLFGMTRYLEDGSPVLRNSAVLIDGSGIQISDKVFLAPIMETGLPFGPISDLQSGERRIQTLNGETRILPLICYEIAFPIDVLELEPRPDIIITIAAQTGFITWMVEEIAQRHARARELETGIRVVHVNDVGTN